VVDVGDEGEPRSAEIQCGDALFAAGQPQVGHPCSAHEAVAASMPRLPGWRVGLTATTLTGALIACEAEFANLSTKVAPDRLLTATSDVAKKILNRVL
jgi:hypothetical protein